MYPNRRSIRLRDHDYRRPGAYFVTICVQDRRCLFGAVEKRQMKVNEAGMSIADYWAKLPSRFPSVKTDAFVVMPNHVHGIIVIVGADRSVCPREGAGEDGGSSADVPASLPEVVRWFKTVTTNAYSLGVKERDWPAYSGRPWQRNYYEHVIRNEISLSQIRTYIRFNPSCGRTTGRTPPGRR